MLPKKIISSATSDLVTDQRLHRVNKTLGNQGFDILVIGRKLKNSLPLSERAYKVKRMKLLFSKGMLFYAEYNVRLFFRLLFTKADVLYSNDLDTLLANTLVSKIKGKSLIYDSHEYFTEVPELVNRPFVRSVWKRIESYCMPSVDIAFTVSESIAAAYKNEYGKEFHVLRNLPEQYDLDKKKDQNVDFPEVGDKKVILYQGSVNVDRGLEEMIDAMAYLEGFVLLIIGHGDIFQELENKVSKVKGKERIHLLGRIPFEKLPEYTVRCDLGISIEKANGLSYTYAMPNKLFDYIQGGIPSIMSDLPEMKKLNDEYNIAIILKNHKALSMADQIKELFSSDSVYKGLKENALKTREVLNWERESKVLISNVADCLGQS